MPWHNIPVITRKAVRSYLKETRPRFIENAAKLAKAVNKAYPVIGRPREWRLGVAFEEIALGQFEGVYQELDESLEAVVRGTMRAPNPSMAGGITELLGARINASGTDPPITELVPLSVRNYLNEAWDWDAYTRPHALTILASMNVNTLSTALLEGWAKDQTQARDLLRFVRMLTNYGYPPNGITVMSNNLKTGLAMKKGGNTITPVDGA